MEHSNVQFWRVIISLTIMLTHKDRKATLLTIFQRTTRNNDHWHNKVSTSQTTICKFYKLIDITNMLNRHSVQEQQGVALTGPNRTGPPCSVGRRTCHAPGGRPTRPAAGSVTDDDRRRQQTTTTDANRRQRAKQYWPIGGPVITNSSALFVHWQRLRKWAVFRLLGSTAQYAAVQILATTITEICAAVNNKCEAINPLIHDTRNTPNSE